MRHASVISTLMEVLLSTGAFGFAGETIRLASGEWPPYQSAAFKHAGVVKRNKHLIRLFNRGLQQLKSTEKLDQYMAESRRGDYRP